MNDIPHELGILPQQSLIFLWAEAPREDCPGIVGVCRPNNRGRSGVRIPIGTDLQHEFRISFGSKSTFQSGLKRGCGESGYAMCLGSEAFSNLAPV
jgi:hypothetical protein